MLLHKELKDCLRKRVQTIRRGEIQDDLFYEEYTTFVDESALYSVLIGRSYENCENRLVLDEVWELVIPGTFSDLRETLTRSAAGSVKEQFDLITKLIRKLVKAYADSNSSSITHVGILRQSLTHV